MTAKGRVYLRLGRVSNLPTVWTNVVAGVFLAGATPRPATLVPLCAAASLFYVGGMFLNDAFDREIDARERPERPIPAGLVSALEVRGVGFGMLVAGIGIVALISPRFGPLASAIGLAVAIVVYDAWHKGNPASPALMGLCRVLVYVTAALAVSDRLGAAVTAGALCLFAHLIGLSYVAKQENLSVVRNLWPLGFVVVPFVYGAPIALGSPVGAAVYAALLFSVTHAISLLRRRGPGHIPRAVTGLIAAISLVDALLVAGTGAGTAALLVALGWPLTRVLQRWVPGT